MRKLEAKLSKWHEKRYGKDYKVDLNRTMVKLVEEVGELARGLLRGDWENAREEAADVAILCVHLVRGMNSSLRNEIKRKHKIIEQRLKEKTK